MFLLEKYNIYLYLSTIFKKQLTSLFFSLFLLNPKIRLHSTIACVSFLKTLCVASPLSRSIMLYKNHSFECCFILPMF